MPCTIFMCGHGSYKPNDGYFDLPKSCSLEFIVNHAKLLPTDDMYRVCEGIYKAKSDRIVNEFGSVPNMTWTADEPFKIDICKKRLLANKKVKAGLVIFPNDFGAQLNLQHSITLKEWFSKNEEAIRNTVAKDGELLFVWNCCSHLALKPSVKGADIGMNAGQFEDKYLFLDLTNQIKPTGRIVYR